MKKLKRPPKKPQLLLPAPSVATDAKAKAVLAAGAGWDRMSKPTGTAADRAQARANARVKTGELRRIAMMEFVTDTESKSVHWHYTHSDREFHKFMRPEQFEKWARDDDWHSRRTHYWEEVVKYVETQFIERVAMQRIKEIERFTMATESISEYALPRRNEKGEILRHPPGHELAGLPVFPLGMPDFDKLITSLLSLQKSLMLLRGEATSRQENIGEDGVKRKALDPTGSKMVLSTDEIRAMSRVLLHKRQPELVEDAIDVEAETGDVEDENGPR